MKAKYLAKKLKKQINREKAAAAKITAEEMAEQIFLQSRGIEAGKLNRWTLLKLKIQDFFRSNNYFRHFKFWA